MSDHFDNRKENVSQPEAATNSQANQPQGKAFYVPDIPSFDYSRCRQETSNSTANTQSIPLRTTPQLVPQQPQPQPLIIPITCSEQQTATVQASDDTPATNWDSSRSKAFETNASEICTNIGPSRTWSCFTSSPRDDTTQNNVAVLSKCTSVVNNSDDFDAERSTTSLPINLSGLNISMNFDVPRNQSNEWITEQRSPQTRRVRTESCDQNNSDLSSEAEGCGTASTQTDMSLSILIPVAEQKESDHSITIDQQRIEADLKKKHEKRSHSSVDDRSIDTIKRTNKAHLVREVGKPTRRHQSPSSPNKEADEKSKPNKSNEDDKLDKASLATRIDSVKSFQMRRAIAVGSISTAIAALIFSIVFGCQLDKLKYSDINPQWFGCRVVLDFKTAYARHIIGVVSNNMEEDPVKPEVNPFIGEIKITYTYKVGFLHEKSAKQRFKNLFTRKKPREERSQLIPIPPQCHPAPPNHLGMFRITYLKRDVSKVIIHLPMDIMWLKMPIISRQKMKPVDFPAAPNIEWNELCEGSIKFKTSHIPVIYYSLEEYLLIKFKDSRNATIHLPLPKHCIANSNSNATVSTHKSGKYVYAVIRLALYTVEMNTFYPLEKIDY